MKYLLNEDQRGFRESLQRLLKCKADSTVLHRIADRSDGWEHALLALWKEYSALGFSGVLIPVEHEGLGLSLYDAAIIAEVLGANTAPLPDFSHHLCCLAITLAGTHDQKVRWLPKLARGEYVGSIAFSAGSGNYCPAEWKTPIHAPEPVTVDLCPVLGINDVPHVFVVGLAGGGLGIVASDIAGVSLQSVACVDLTRFLATLSFDPSSIDVMPEGSNYSEAVYHAGLALLATDSVGGIIACVDQAVSYAKMREQFGVQIGHFQAVKHQIAEIALLGEPNRPLCWHAAQAVDARLPTANRTATIAKAHLSEAFLATARQTVELHGGFGYTWEADIHFYLKRAMFNATYLGNAHLLYRHLSRHSHIQHREPA